jgi:hypothetical protein
MEQKADAEVDRQPRQVEQSDRAGAGEEAADGVKVADRLRAFAPDAERERQADDGVIDAQAQRFVEAVDDADQDPAADSVDDALCGVGPDARIRRATRVGTLRLGITRS